ncbi:hypothetical protein GQ42DRAFT_179031 [Ramicandelaber brevisporus]|nr:hypothetical protein GQ42DRAFT_179031 [Ramicandelaber brevisporus]
MPTVREVLSLIVEYLGYLGRFILSLRLFTKVFVGISIGLELWDLWLAARLKPRVADRLGLEPERTWADLQFFRLVLYPFVNRSILQTVLVLWAVVYFLDRAERQLGTIRAAWVSLVIFTTIPGFFLLLLGKLLYKEDTLNMYTGAAGLFYSWLVWRCSSSEAPPTMRLFGLIPLPMQFIPWLVFAFTQLIAGFPNSYFIHDALGMVMGFLYSSGLLRLIEPSGARCAQLDSSILGRILVPFGGYVEADSSGTALPLFMNSGSSSGGAGGGGGATNSAGYTSLSGDGTSGNEGSGSFASRIIGAGNIFGFASANQAPANESTPS